MHQHIQLLATTTLYFSAAVSIQFHLPQRIIHIVHSANDTSRFFAVHCTNSLSRVKWCLARRASSHHTTSPYNVRLHVRERRMTKTTQAAIAARTAQCQCQAALRILGVVRIHKPNTTTIRGVRSVATSLARQAATHIAAALFARSLCGATRAAVARFHLQHWAPHLPIWSHSALQQGARLIARYPTRLWMLAEHGVATLQPNAASHQLYAAVSAACVAAA